MSRFGQTNHPLVVEQPATMVDWSTFLRIQTVNDASEGNEVAMVGTNRTRCQMSASPGFAAVHPGRIGTWTAPNNATWRRNMKISNLVPILASLWWRKVIRSMKPTTSAVINFDADHLANDFAHARNIYAGLKDARTNPRVVMHFMQRNGSYQFHVCNVR